LSGIIANSHRACELCRTVKREVAMVASGRAVAESLFRKERGLTIDRGNRSLSAISKYEVDWKPIFALACLCPDILQQWFARSRHTKLEHKMVAARLSKIISFHDSWHAQWPLLLHLPGGASCPCRARCPLGTAPVESPSELRERKSSSNLTGMYFSETMESSALPCRLTKYCHPRPQR